MSKRLIVYCERQTEEQFIKRFLRHHLNLFGVKVEEPILAATSLDPDGRRGGFSNWNAMSFDLENIFASDSGTDLRFTTLLDVYAMPAKILELAGYNSPVTSVEDIEAVEAALERIFDEPRFVPYLQRHEF